MGHNGTSKQRWTGWTEFSRAAVNTVSLQVLEWFLLMVRFLNDRSPAGCRIAHRRSCLASGGSCHTIGGNYRIVGYPYDEVVKIQQKTTTSSAKLRCMGGDRQHEHHKVILRLRVWAGAKGHPMVE